MIAIYVVITPASSSALIVSGWVLWGIKCTDSKSAGSEITVVPLGSEASSQKAGLGCDAASGWQ
jgi:hypothetical protein